MWRLFIFLGLVTVAALSGVVAGPGEWYDSLNKPAWNPPNAIFAPVWTVLYVFIAIAGWRVWEQTRSAKNLAIILWGVQLILNGLWTILFFKLQEPGLALLDIMALLASIIAFVFVAWEHSKLASVLFLPYALWVTFAAALNFAIWSLN